MELMEQFPGLKIEGGPYTPPAYVQYGLRAVRFSQVLVGIFFFFGEQILGALGHQPFDFMSETHTNLGVHIAAMYGLNVIADLLKSINAFEIVYNGKVLHSKLTDGKFPEPGQVSNKLKDALASEKGADNLS
jgi:selT/selW/selH-like putative selenoprotein